MNIMIQGLLFLRWLWRLLPTPLRRLLVSCVVRYVQKQFYKLVRDAAESLARRVWRWLCDFFGGFGRASWA